MKKVLFVLVCSLLLCSYSTAQAKQNAGLISENDMVKVYQISRRPDLYVIYDKETNHQYISTGMGICTRLDNNGNPLRGEP